MNKKRTNTNTGFKGVTKRGENRFEAWLNIKGLGKTHIGTRKTLQDAVYARNEFITNLI